MLFRMLREQRCFRLYDVLFLLLLTLSGHRLVYAQSDTASSEEQRQASHVSSTTADFRLNVVWNSRFGNFTYVPEKWGNLHLTLQNSIDTPRNLLCATYFDEQPALQFGREVWLPAQSRLRMTHPVLVPKYSESKGRTINLHSLVIDRSSSDEVLVKNDAGQLLHETSMLVTHSLRNTGITSGSRSDERVPLDVMNLVVAVRVDQRMNNKVTVLGDQFLPTDETGLSRLDHIVITEDRFADDFAAMSALRHWVSTGGRLWIMIDRVKPQFLERLLGDDFTSCVVDRVELTSVRIDRPALLIDPVEVPGEAVEHDVPVELVRMIPSNMDVSFTVNGWPAAMTRTYGEGRILLTTLGASGWIKRRAANAGGKDSGKPVDPLTISEFAPVPAMLVLGSEFFRIRNPDLIAQTEIERQAQEYIGYRIPSFWLIVGFLFSFLIVQLATGIWLMRTGRLEHLGWISSLLAIAVSSGLLTIGLLNRHGIPGTIASVQLAQAIAGIDEVRSQGSIAVYHPEGSQAQIQTIQGGRMLPDMSGLDGSTRRMVTTDLGAWHWENLAQSAGLRMSSFTKAEAVIDRIEALATFDAKGISGRYSGRLPPGNDAILATRFGRLGVTLQEDGAFTARAEDAFEDSQYLGASILSDEQVRRRHTLEQLFSTTKEKGFVHRPQLLFWTERWEHGFQFGDDLKAQGSTLMSVPLTLQRPANGTDVLIPSAFLSFRNRISPDGSKGSPLWDEFREKWQERSAPSLIWLSFQVPRELLPLVATRVRLSITVSGPAGRIEVQGLRRQDVVSLRTITDPVGTVNFEIDDASALSISDDGQLVLGLNVGDASRPELTRTVIESSNTGPQAGANIHAGAKANYWKIESLRLQLWAKTVEPTANN